MKNGIVNLGLILIIVGVIILGVGVVMLIPSVTGGDGVSGKRNIECRIMLDEQTIGTDVDIESINCVDRGSCLLSISTLGIFGTEGNVQMLVDQKAKDSKVIDTDIFGNADVILNVCTSFKKGSVRTLNNDGNVVDERSWSVG